MDAQCEVCGRGPPKPSRQETIVYQKHLPETCSFCGDNSYVSNIPPENAITVNITNTQRVLGGSYAQYYRPDVPLNMVNANPSTRVIQDVVQPGSYYAPSVNLQTQESPQKLFENVRLGQSQVIENASQPDLNYGRSQTLPIGIRTSTVSDGIFMSRQKSVDLENVIVKIFTMK